MREDQKSDALQLLDIVWAGANASTSFSWERLNHSMSSALTLAIGSGLQFARDDITFIRSAYSSSRWIGETWEWVYGFAVAVGNRSAIESFEASFKRIGFISDNVDIGRDGQGFLHGSSSRRQRERLTVGATFTWKGIKVKVTSFAEDSSYLVACSYRKEPPEYGHCEACKHVTSWPKEVLNKRFKISREDIVADRKERKNRAAIKLRLDAAGKKTCEQAQEAYREAGVTTRAELDALPFEEFRAIAERFLPPAEERKRMKKSERGKNYEIQ